MEESKCFICTERNTPFRKLHEIDDKSSLKAKLQLLVPEMEWPDESSICRNCTESLLITCKFRELCLKLKHKTDKHGIIRDCRLNNCYSKSENCEIEEINENQIYSNVFKVECKENITTEQCNKIEIVKSEFETYDDKNSMEKTLTSDSNSFDKTSYNSKGCYTDDSDINITNAETLNCTEETVGRENVNTIPCKFCDKLSRSVTNLRNHISKEHPDENDKIKKLNPSERDWDFRCHICNESFTLLKEVFNHYSKIHSVDRDSVKPYTCKICRSRFKTSSNLKTHIQRHQADRKEICIICGKSFTTKPDLITHEKIHEHQNKYKCDKCQKSFKSNSNLRSHCLIVHTDPILWKYECHICGKRFPQKSNHDLHLRRHVGEKNFSCHLCQKTFTSKSEMQGHVVRHHSNEKEHKCEVCGKEFRQKRSYKEHLTRIHGIGNAKMRTRQRKHGCHLCPGMFYDKQKLARHLCTHSGLKPFPCSACPKKFTDKSYLKQHLKGFHKIFDSDLRITTFTNATSKSIT